eukprot:2569282-Prymnesium_polylepis.1
MTGCARGLRRPLTATRDERLTSGEPLCAWKRSDGAYSEMPLSPGSCRSHSPPCRKESSSGPA